MTRLKFNDIDEWTPSSISIVDVPAHPLCRFEVYEDDEEYVKKSIEINEGEDMEKQNPQIEEPMVQAPVSFFERLLGRTVAKAVEDEPPKEEEKADSDILARIEKLEKRVAELEKEPEEKPKENENEPAPGAVAKSEGEGESEGEAQAAETEETTEEIIDEKEVVAKSKSIDPDNIHYTDSSETLLERTGRNRNGMTW